MALLLYNLSIFFYRIGVSFASLFNEKAAAFIAGRKDWRKKMQEAFSDNEDSVAWFHCASLGEFEQGRPVMEDLKREFPNHKILLTFFSPSGYEVRKNYHGADYIFYLPLDTKRNARDFIAIVNPSVVFFVKYEFWYHFVKRLSEQKIPVLSFSTIFRPGQLFFKKYGRFYANILKRFDYFFLQDIRSKDLLNAIEIKNCEVSGDTRFDRVWEICSKQQDLPQVADFAHYASVMVVGSCWPEDIEVLTPFINDSGLKFIIAPHEIEERFMAQMEKELMRRTIRYSQIKDVDLSKFEVLIIDNVGMLSGLYKYGRYAYVGGGYGRGLHNILEPATFGVPIFFGDKNYGKFKEAIDLIKLGGAVAIADYDALRTQFHAFSEAKTYEIASQINRDYVQNNIGASKRIIKYCQDILQ